MDYKFKVGDKVQRFVGYHMGSDVGTISTVKEISGAISMTLVELGGTHNPTNFNLAEEKWVPKQGELIEVLHHKEWIKRVFIGMDGGQAVIKGHVVDYASFNHFRQIKPTKTITIDGKDIEISVESFEAFKEQFCK